MILLNDMKKLKGGDLELMKMCKNKGLRELEAGRIEHGVNTEIINYEKPGKMILAQGSEVLHRVTPVYSTEEQR